MRGRGDWDSADRERLQRWRERRRAREARRARVERGWRENPASSRGLRVTDVRKADWLAAMRWRRQIQATCTGSGLTFTQWLVLDSAQQLIRVTKDAVIQSEIAARLELDQATISEVIRRLEAKHMLSRDVDITGIARRVLLTDTAEELLHNLEAGLEAASAAAR